MSSFFVDVLNDQILHAARDIIMIFRLDSKIIIYISFPYSFQEVGERERERDKEFL